MNNISPSMVKGLSPELILQYLNTDYSPLYNSLKDAATNRRLYDDLRFKKEQDERNFALTKQEADRTAANNAFAQNIASQQERRAQEKYDLGRTPYDKNYLSGLFQTFSGGEAPQELINALTSVPREEAAGLLPGLSQYAINQRQQKKQDFEASEREKAQTFKAEQAEKAAERKSAFQAYAEEAAMSRIKMRAGLKMSAQEDQQAFTRDRDQFKAQQQTLLQEGRISSAEAMQNMRTYTDTYLRLRDQEIKEAGLRSDPSRQGQTININYGNVPDQVNGIMGNAPQPQKQTQPPAKFGYSNATGKWGVYGTDEMPSTEERKPLVGPSGQLKVQHDVEQLESLISEGNKDKLLEAIKRVQNSSYPQELKITMLKRLQEGIRSSTTPAWRSR